MPLTNKLPTPIGRQKEVLYLPSKGHTIVLGTAGSGKTTLAIHRAAYLSHPQTDHHGRTLLVTFNNTLVSYLRYLTQSNLTNVVVENYHKFARGYLAFRGKMSRGGICDSKRRKQLIAEAIKTVRSTYKPLPFFDKPLAFFCDEIRWIIQHGIESRDEYQDAERIGRSGARIDSTFRPHAFHIYETYIALRNHYGYKYDWDDLATAVCSELDQDSSVRMYKHIVIDEGQDFSPQMILSLAKAIPDDGSITFFGDVAQQIYGHRISWRTAGLNTSKVWHFKENYRNSKQIAALALAISDMPYFKGGPDIVAPSAPVADGPLPLIVKCTSIAAELDFIKKQAARSPKTQRMAILVRRREHEQLFSGSLPSGSIRLHKDMNQWNGATGVYYGTYHSAKGLEFDSVLLPFCDRDHLPDPEDIAAFGIDDSLAKDGRLLYVGVTRARLTLIMSYTGKKTDLLPKLSALYNKVEL